MRTTSLLKVKKTDTYESYKVLASQVTINVNCAILSEGVADGEDILQCNNAASSRTPRGHQFPGAFLAETSGITKVSWLG